MKTDNNTQQLPAEVIAAINQLVEDKVKKEKEYWAKTASDPDRTKTYIAGYEHGVRKGAIEYATKLHVAQQEIESLTNQLKNHGKVSDENMKLLWHENERLRRWKDEYFELLNPILDYGQSKEAAIPLGESITSVVLERCKQHDAARTLLSKVYDDFIGSTEMSENKTDKRLFKQIKQFLDGKK